MTPDNGGALLGFGVLFNLFGQGFVFCRIGELILPGGGGLVLGHGNVFHFENLKPTPDHRLRFRSKMPHGWKEGETPKVADGCRSRRWRGLKHPCLVYVLPKGDVPMVESIAPPAK
ncbi:hypothetical protein [Rhizobium viscosum]|uniref:Uncharacterized protein n=1 Tax=Rhizobium viscosum TaxID=1673 RepID=A0ABR9IVF6_RHIVS|nr:hypothetical protein [Rhizobium viscosum]MBE1507179.1 hypothetical protein [Rhizobium viscosum]